MSFGGIFWNFVWWNIWPFNSFSGPIDSCHQAECKGPWASSFLTIYTYHSHSAVPSHSTPRLPPTTDRTSARLCWNVTLSRTSRTSMGTRRWMRPRSAATRTSWKCSRGAKLLLLSPAGERNNRAIFLCIYMYMGRTFQKANEVYVHMGTHQKNVMEKT